MSYSDEIWSIVPVLLISLAGVVVALIGIRRFGGLAGALGALGAGLFALDQVINMLFLQSMSDRMRQMYPPGWVKLFGQHYDLFVWVDRLFTAGGIVLLLFCAFTAKRPAGRPGSPAAGPGAGRYSYPAPGTPMAAYPPGTWPQPIPPQPVPPQPAAGAAWPQQPPAPQSAPPTWPQQPPAPQPPAPQPPAPQPHAPQNPPAAWQQPPASPQQPVNAPPQQPVNPQQPVSAPPQQPNPAYPSPPQPAQPQPPQAPYPPYPPYPPQ